MDTQPKPTQPEQTPTPGPDATTKLPESGPTNPEKTPEQIELEKIKEVNLKKQAEEAIKNYKLKHGNYRVLIRILEANDLVPKIDNGIKIFNNKDGSANPYVTISILDRVKKTVIKKKTLNPVYNQQFYLEFKDLIISQLEEASIIFKVMDYNGLVQSDTLIGTFEMDLTTVYFSFGHELHQVTLLLYDPEDKDVSISGMLKVNVEVLGPDDEPNVHNIISEQKDLNKGKVLKPPRIKPVGHNVEVNLYRAEHLPVLDFSTKGIDAFAVVKYAGQVKSTKIVTSFKPEWNQNIKLACMLPNQSKSVNIEVWDYDLAGSNDLVGAFKVDFKTFRDQFLEPRWVNIYGPTVNAKGSEAEAMKLYGYDLGSCYRGRVLYSIGSYNERDPRTAVTDLKFSFPDNPEPSSAERTYIFRADIYEAQEIPDRFKCLVTFCIGPYRIRSDKILIKNGRCRMYQQIPDTKMILPVNLDEFPDIFVYFSDKRSESRRHSFARLKPEKFLNPVDPPITEIKLKEDKSLDLISDDEFPGFIFAKIALYTTPPPPRAVIKCKNEAMVKYQLRVMIYVARDLPPADEEGSSDPFVVVRSAGEVGRTSVKPMTLNPGWYETVVLNVELPSLENSEVPEGISLLVYDSDHHEKPEEKKELLGRAWVRIENKKRKFRTADGKTYDIIYEKPRWKNIIYDATDEYQGKILVSYALIPAEYAHNIPMEDITPESTAYKVHLFLVGIRNLNPDQLSVLKPASVAVYFDVSGDEYAGEHTDKVEVKNNNANLCLYKELDIGVPYSKALTPLLDVHLNGWKLGSQKSKTFGYASINMRQILSAFYDFNEQANAPLELDIEEDDPLINGQGAADAKDTKDTKAAKGSKDTKDTKANKDDKKAKGGAEGKTMNPDDIKINIFGNNTNEAIKTIENEDVDENVDTETKPMVSFLHDAFTKSTVADPNTVINHKIKRTGFVREEDITTFRIQRENSFEASMIAKDYLQAENMDLVVKPNKAKGDFDMPTRGQVAKKGFLDKFTSLWSKEVIEYYDYDTDPDEPLDVIPAWIVGRETKENELEDYLGENQEIKTLDIKEGRTRGSASFLKFDAPSGTSKIAQLKAIFLEGEGEEIQKKVEKYKELMIPQKYTCRVYILEGVNITKPRHPNTKPDSYLVVKIGNEVKKEVERSFRKGTNRPEYFIRYDFVVELPGSPSLEIEVWHQNKLLKDDFLGSTKIDLEGRHFNPNYQKLEKIPIEYRPLTNDDEKGTYGRLGLWVDLEPINARNPIHEITPVERVDCELRVIVWEAKEFEHNDELTGSSDLYIRGGLGSDWNETDTHWRARAKATYNWRWKFKMSIPMGRDDYKGDTFRVQLFDRDLVTSNTMIGETEISLNTHKMLDKVYKRRAPVKMMMKYKDKKNNEVKTDQIWYDVYHPMRKNEKGDKLSVGKVLLSFELLPIDDANKQPNANGRDQPNNFPALPEPMGRFTFDILSPLKTLKEILGPRLYRSICCGLCFVFIIVIAVCFGYFVLTAALGSAIGG